MLIIRLSLFPKNQLHSIFSSGNTVQLAIGKYVALILSMKLSNYGRNFLHRRVVLIFLYCERLWTEFIASSHNAKPRYILRNIHGFLKLHLLSVKS